MSISSFDIIRGGDMTIRSPTCRITRLFEKQCSLQIKPTVPSGDANFALEAFSGVRAIEPIKPNIFTSPTKG